jgi:NADH-quinone oxidoreductase subunit N
MSAPLLLAAKASALGTPTIALPHIRYLGILPELVLLGGAVLVLGAGALFRRELRVRVATAATVVISGTALGLAIWQWADVQSHGAYTTVDRAVAVDGFSCFVAILVSSAMLVTALIGDGYLRREDVQGAEFHVLAMVSASGAMLMGQANDLIIVFLGLEIMSIALYVLAAFNHRRAASAEGALKYFVLGGFSSAIFVYGIALVYGATGSTNLAQIAAFLSHTVVASDGLLLAGLALLLVGFAFKVAAVPFHMWTPDVYQGSPSPVVGFMAAVAKIGGFAAFLRVFVSSFGLLRGDWQPVVYVIAVASLLVGAVLALVQRDVKRMLAYSSINHAGFVLLGLQAATASGISSALYYLFAYTFMVIGSFAVVTLVGRSGDADHDLTAYRGLAHRQPLLALSFAVLLLAQAGAPFTTGFLAKFQVVVAAVDANSLPLALVAMVSAAVAAFFYLRLAVLMYAPGRRPAAVPPPAEPARPLVGFEAPAAVTVGAPLAALGGLPAGTAPGGLALAGGRLGVVDRLNAALLFDDEAPAPAGTAEGVEAPGTEVVEAPQTEGVEVAEADAAEAAAHPRVPVPALAAVGIGICLAVSVVFGIIPGPLTDFAHRATLLFVP